MQFTDDNKLGSIVNAEGHWNIRHGEWGNLENWVEIQ